MTEIGTFSINNMPNAARVFRALGSSFNCPSQPVCEMVDNAISNLRKHKGAGYILPAIRIAVRKLDEDVEIIVEDGGSGIEDLDNAMTLAGMDAQDSPLNEHGYGLKHTFAYIDNNKGSWLLATRTREDVGLNRCRCIEPPYDFGTGAIHGTYNSGWIGTLNQTGTYIRLTFPLRVFETLARGRRKKRPFSELTDILKEILCCTYARVLALEDIEMILTCSDGMIETTETLEPIFPTWDTETMKTLPDQMVDLGGGEVKVECRYGIIIPNKEGHRYYRGNMASSGVEISVNNRIIQNGLIRQIWEKTTHNSMNGFLVQINLVTDSREALPATKAAKNGFRLEHPYVEQLFTWIRSNVVVPGECYQTTEARLLDKLKAKLETQPDVLRAEREFTVFRNLDINVPIDLYVSRNGKGIIYEGKSCKSQPQHVVQMDMYRKGCLVDGIAADEAVLVAREHPQSVLNMIKFYNDEAAGAGSSFRFRVTTWDAEGISL